MRASRGCKTREAAARIKSGINVLPQGMIKGIGAAPVDDVPEGVKVDWIAVVCNPYWAGFIGGARRGCRVAL